MGEDPGDNRDPLLVRPFVLPDGAEPEPPMSASTWPVEQTAGELPTQLLPVVPTVDEDQPGPGGPAARRRRALLLLVGAGMTSAAVVAGYVMLRPADRSADWTSQPGHSLPVVVGPTPKASAASSAAALGTADSTANATGVKDTPDATATSAPAPEPSSPPAGAGNPANPSAGSSAAASGSPTTVPALPPINFAPGAIPAGRGLLVTGNGLCLDLRGGDAAEGSDVHVDDCNGTSPQRWQLNSDRTLEVLDMCAYLVGDGTVELTRCDGRTTAQWQLFPDGSLVNAATAQCLTDPSSGSRPGRPVIATACGGGNNQRWAFR